MGIKGWIFIGAGLALTALVWLGLKREEDLCTEKAEKIIREVDGNKKEEEIPSVDEMADDVEKAFREMNLDEETADTADEATRRERAVENAFKLMKQDCEKDPERFEREFRVIEEELKTKAESD